MVFRSWLLLLFGDCAVILLKLTSALSETIYGGRVFLFFSTLLAWAEWVSSKNKTYVPPGLWEQGPPAYCFGIWGWTGRIWPRERYCRVDTDRGGRAAAVLSRKELRKCPLAYIQYMCKLFCNVHLGNWNKVCSVVQTARNHWRLKCGAARLCVCESVSQMGWGVVRITVHNAEYTQLKRCIHEPFYWFSKPSGSQ